MAAFKVRTRYKKLLADTITPVSIYLQLRDKFMNSILLESSDYHTASNSFSYICCQPVGYIKINQGVVTQQFPNENSETYELENPKDAVKAIQNFSKQFEPENTGFPFITNGLFGHISYDAVNYFEDIQLQPQEKATENNQIIYQVFRYVIAINHIKNELYLFEHKYSDLNQEAGLERLKVLIRNTNFPKYNFKTTADES